MIHAKRLLPLEEPSEERSFQMVLQNEHILGLACRCTEKSDGVEAVSKP
jgi:hypothetical protein